MLRFDLRYSCSSSEEPNRLCLLTVSTPEAGDGTVAGLLQSRRAERQEQHTWPVHSHMNTGTLREIAIWREIFVTGVYFQEGINYSRMDRLHLLLGVGP